MVYAVLLKIMHTTHVTLTGVYKSVVNEIDHDRAHLVHSSCVTLIQRNGQRALRKNAKPEPRNPGSSLFAPAWSCLNITILVTIARRFLVTWSLQIKLRTRLLHVKRSRIVTFLYVYTRSEAVFLRYLWSIYLVEKVTWKDGTRRPKKCFFKHCNIRQSWRHTHSFVLRMSTAVCKSERSSTHFS